MKKIQLGDIKLHSPEERKLLKAIEDYFDNSDNKEQQRMARIISGKLKKIGEKLINKILKE